jgi:hypothetical protein
MEHDMNDYLIHSGKLGMKWHHHDKDAYQTKSGNWVYGRNKPSGSRILKLAKTDSKITGADDILDDAAKTNVVGKRANYNPSRNQNCMSCAIAYDLRRAGNKVQAIETVEGISAYTVADIYKKTKITDYVISAKRTGTFKSLTAGMTNSEFDSMVNHLKSDGENSRGILVANWKSKHSENYAGGHAMNYEVKNGKFYLIDSQTGKVYDEQSSRKQLSNTYDVMTLRTDNRRINLDYAKSYFVEPEGTKTTNLRKGTALYVASKVSGAIGKGGSAISATSKVAAPLLIGLSVMNPTFYTVSKVAGAAVIGGSAVSAASKKAAQKVIQNNRNETASNIIEKLTGDKVDPKMLSANAVDIMKRLPEYKRIYKMQFGDERFDNVKIISGLKTTDGNNTVNNAVENVPNGKRVSTSAPSQTTRNTSIGVTSSQKGSMKSLYAKGVPIDEIAEKLGVSPSTVSKYLK